MLIKTFFTSFVIKGQVHWCGSRSGILFLKLSQFFIQLYLKDCVPQICVLRRGILRSNFVLDLVWQLWLLPSTLGQQKNWLHFGIVSICDIKRQFSRCNRSGNSKIFNSLQYCIIEFCSFLNKVFQGSVLQFLYFLLVSSVCMLPQLRSIQQVGRKKRMVCYLQ